MANQHVSSEIAIPNNTGVRHDWRPSNLGLIPKLAYALKTEQFPDVSFAFGNSDSKSEEVVKAHKFMLSVHSPVFEVMFTEHYKDSNTSVEEPILITDIQPDVFKSMLGFMYTGKLPDTELSTEYVFDIMYAANKYDVLELKRACSDTIAARIVDKNVVSIFQNAQTLNDKILTDKAKAFIQLNFHSLLSCEDFLNFSYENLLELLADSETHNENEISVFRALVKWSEAECHRQKLDVIPVNKRSVLGDIINLIQFLKITPENISRDVCNSSILNQDESHLLLRHATVSENDRSDLQPLPYKLINRKRKSDVDAANNAKVAYRGW